ncbi:Cupin superfamily protein [compost metagenome]
MNIALDISFPEFFGQYQEKKPLLVKGAVSIDHFSWHDANEIFDRADVASNDFKLSYDGIRPKHEYVESYLDIGTLRHRLIKPVVYDYLKKGATLIANKLVNEPKVDALARQIADFTGRQTVTSAYAAFGERDSFRAHWDTRDVFVIQLIGRKRWIVYEPSFESPLYMQQSKDVEQHYPCPKEPYMDFILEAGDVFYLPRGWWHNPLPIGEETFHLAVGTFPAYATDYMEWALRQLPSFVGARKSLSTWDADKENLASVGRYIDDFINDPDNY